MSNAAQTVLMAHDDRRCRLGQTHRRTSGSVGFAAKNHATGGEGGFDPRDRLIG